RKTPGGDLRRRDVVELIGEAPALSDEHDARHRREKGASLRRYQIGAYDVDAAARRAGGDLRARLALADQGLERDLKVLDIGRGALVQDDQVDGESLHP